MCSAIRSVSALTAAASPAHPARRSNRADRQEIASRERVAEDDCHARAKRGLAIEVEADGHERHRRAFPFGREHHPRRTCAERFQPPGRVADPFRKDADRVAGRESGGDGSESLGVLRCIDALIDLAIDGDCAGAREHPSERTVEERGFGEEPDVAPGRRPYDRGIEERVRVIGQEQHGAALRHRANPVGPVEDPARGPRQPADRRVRTRAHFR